MVLPYVRPERFFNEDGSLKFDPKSDRLRNPDFLLFGPTYAEPRQEFQFVENWLRELGKIPENDRYHVSKPQDGPWRLTTSDGVVVATWSMEDPTSIRSVDLEGAAVCEAGKCPYHGIERVQGRISAKRGFCVYSGTLENGQQWFQDWAIMGRRPNDKQIVSYSLPSFANLHEYPGGRDDPEIKRLEAFYPEDVFAMRVLAEPRPPRDRVLKEVLPSHIGRIRIPRDAAVEIWIDPGYASAYAILFVAHWDRGGQKFFYIFDEFYEQTKTTGDMIQLVTQHRAWPKITQGIIDVAAKGHRDGGESALEIWRKKTRLNWNMKYWREEAQTERIRTSAKANQFLISPRCKGLIAECGLGEPVFPEMHPWKFLVDNDGRVKGERPIDRWNHSAKALAYGLLHHLGQVEGRRQAKSVNRLARKTRAA